LTDNSPDAPAASHRLANETHFRSCRVCARAATKLVHHFGAGILDRFDMTPQAFAVEPKLVELVSTQDTLSEPNGLARTVLHDGKLQTPQGRALSESEEFKYTGPVHVHGSTYVIPIVIRSDAQGNLSYELENVLLSGNPDPHEKYSRLEEDIILFTSAFCDAAQHQGDHDGVHSPAQEGPSTAHVGNGTEFAGAT
jgi:hypothetical protein